MNNSLSNQKPSDEPQNIKIDRALDKALEPKKISGHKISIVVLIFLIFIVLVQVVELNYIKQYAKAQAQSAPASGAPSAQPKTGLPSQVGGC